MRQNVYGYKRCWIRSKRSVRCVLWIRFGSFRRRASRALAGVGALFRFADLEAVLQQRLHARLSGVLFLELLAQTTE